MGRTVLRLRTSHLEACCTPAQGRPGLPSPHLSGTGTSPATNNCSMVECCQRMLLRLLQACLCNPINEWPCNDCVHGARRCELWRACERTSLPEKLRFQKKYNVTRLLARCQPSRWLKQCVMMVYQRPSLMCARLSVKLRAMKDGSSRQLIHATMFAPTSSLSAVSQSNLFGRLLQG